MMDLPWIRRLTTRRAPPAPAEVKPAVASRPNDDLRYPPSDNGLRVLAPEEILASNSELVARLRLHAATPEPEFVDAYLAPLLRMAAHINVLPATSSGLFAGETGLFRACLETAFFSFQSSDGRIFTGSEGVERRHALESRWRYLCFLAGMFYPLGKPLERIAVAGPDGKVWKRHFHGLTEWAAASGVDRIFVSWGTHDEDEAIGPSNSGMALLPQIVGPANLQMLQDGAGELVVALYQLASGETGTSRIAHQVVTGCWERIAMREAARRPQAFGRLVSGTHQGPYLVGAVRALVESGAWTPNKSCLRADRTGLYLQWPDAARELAAYGVVKGYAGWPDDAPTLAALLKAARVVENLGTDLGMLEIVDEQGEIRHALKIVNPLAVLEDFDPGKYDSRPGKTLEAVLEADPLARSEAAASQAAVGATAAPQSTVAPTTGAPQPLAPEPAAAEQLTLDAVTEQADAPEAAGTLPDSKSPADRNKLREAPEVRYADLVPEDIRNEIGNALQVELLGKVIKAWRGRGERSDIMRHTDNGAAIAFSFLVANMRDATTWVDSMARAGLIYCPPQKPGLRVQKVAIPEGRSPVDAIVLSSLACRRLGL